MVTASCGTCVFFYSYSLRTSPELGNCCRYPPSVRDGQIMRFVVVDSTAWCGEYREDVERVQRAEKERYKVEDDRG